MAAGFRQVYWFMFARRLPQIGQHQATDLRRLAGRLQGVCQGFKDDRVPWRVIHSHFEVPHHDMELVVEMVGDSASHEAKAFDLLKLPVPNLEFHLFRSGTLSHKRLII